MMRTVHAFFNRYFYILVLFLVFSQVLQVATDSDTWWHLRAGQWMVENRAFLTADPFSYTKAGVEWVHTGAPFQVLLYLTYQAAGFGGINLLAAGIITLAFAILWHALEGRAAIRATAVIGGAAIAAVYGAARPHLTSLVFMAVALWLFESLRKGRMAGLLVFPLLMAAWANSHAGFWMGFVLLGVYGLESLLEINRQSGLRDWLRAACSGMPGRMALSGLWGLVATLANPFTWRIYEAVADTFVRKAESQYISEWLSPNFHDPALYPLLAGILVTVALLAVSRRTLRPAHLLLILGMLFMSLTSTRHLAMYAIAMPVVWSSALSALAQDGGFSSLAARIDLPERHRQALAACSLLYLTGVLVVALFYAIPASTSQKVFDGYYPSETLAYLRQQRPAGRLFNSYNWGGYLLWTLPEYPVYIDGRTDLFRDELFLEWVKVISAEDGWGQELDRWNVCAVLIEPGRPIAKVLPLSGWQEAARDDTSVLFTRPCSAISE